MTDFARISTVQQWCKHFACIPQVIKSFTFWAGGLAGVVSAAATHQLDVAKTLRHVGKSMPEKFSDYFVGMAMGSFAQGFRFAVTLILNMTLQMLGNAWTSGKKMQREEPDDATWFSISMLAAGIGEFLANPPVVIKNYQLAWVCCGNPLPMGIGPTKAILGVAFPQLQTNKVMLSFCAGSLTGSFAEVITNPPDQVKTMTQAGVPFFEAVSLAMRHPFRGAGFAGLRKAGLPV
ncbi:Uncharacterized protein SCF082_LOCUS41627 [Durusdinium trenchii]|uniref:Uncharacterized protein n=1 Tax=Durusdinium trenchii TaxID=1381693 RepID=A0ABP0QIS3_9DINO